MTDVVISAVIALIAIGLIKLVKYAEDRNQCTYTNEEEM